MLDKPLKTLVAALRYLGPVFALGWLLGPLRESLIVPRFGRTVGSAIEMPLMVAATYASARATIRRSGGDPPLATRLATGALAFGMLGVLELAGARLVRRLSVNAYLATFRTPAGAMSLAAFTWFAFAPALVKRHRSSN